MTDETHGFPLLCPGCGAALIALGTLPVAPPITVGVYICGRRARRTGQAGVRFGKRPAGCRMNKVVRQVARLVTKGSATDTSRKTEKGKDR